MAGWWGVRIQSRSTINSLMDFQIALASLPKTSVSVAWANIPETSSRTPAAQALSNLLYYTKNVAM